MVFFMDTSKIADKFFGGGGGGTQFTMYVLGLHLLIILFIFFCCGGKL